MRKMFDKLNYLIYRVRRWRRSRAMAKEKNQIYPMW